MMMLRVMLGSMLFFCRSGEAKDQ
jgi:hypothetical protein